MVMNRIQSNRMPTDGGVRGGRGAEEDILFRRCTYRTKTFYISYEDVLHRRSSGWRHSVVNDYSTVCTIT